MTLTTTDFARAGTEHAPWALTDRRTPERRIGRSCRLRLSKSVQAGTETGPPGWVKRKASGSPFRSSGTRSAVLVNARCRPLAERSGSLETPSTLSAECRTR